MNILNKLGLCAYVCVEVLCSCFVFVLFFIRFSAFCWMASCLDNLVQPFHPQQSLQHVLPIGNVSVKNML